MEFLVTRTDGGEMSVHTIPQASRQGTGLDGLVSPMSQGCALGPRRRRLPSCCISIHCMFLHGLGLEMRDGVPYQPSNGFEWVVDRPVWDGGEGQGQKRGTETKMQPHRYHGGSLPRPLHQTPASILCVHIHVHVHVHIRPHTHERPCPRTACRAPSNRGKSGVSKVILPCVHACMHSLPHG